MINLTDIDLPLILGIAIGCVVLIILGILIFVIIKNKKKQDFLAMRKEKDLQIIDALGGKDNIISYKANGSRLSLSLNDYSLIDEKSLKEHGVSSIIKMSNKITLVIGEEAKDIEEYLRNDH